LRRERISFLLKKGPGLRKGMPPIVSKGLGGKKKKKTLDLSVANKKRLKKKKQGGLRWSCYAEKGVRFS